MDLDHIALIISKEENLEFYKRLGFKETKRFERSYDKVVFMECDGVVLEIFVDSNHPDRSNKPEAMGLRHIALSVESFEELEVDIEEIKTDWFGRRISFIKDYDGQVIELIERKQ